MNMAEFLHAAKPKYDKRTCITLRDQFAMAALSGLSAKVSSHEMAMDEGYRYLMLESFASFAYEAADAMLKEREK